MTYTFDIFIVAGIFLIYYLATLIFNKKLITDSGEIISKFFTSLLLYGGVLLIYFSFTKESLPNSGFQEITIYFFIAGFLAIMFSLPNLLKDFGQFKKIIFTRRHSDRN